VITTPDGSCRNLPKLAWLLIVVLLADLGSLAWLVAGRPWSRQVAGPRLGTRGRVRASAGQRPMSPDDDEEFLATLRARAEEQRRRARELQQRHEPPSDEPAA
jgi:hypothetical protein